MAGVREEIEFATEPKIATEQLRAVRQSGARRYLLADAGYRDDTSFREAVSELRLQYAVGIRSNTRVWTPGTVLYRASLARGRRAGRVACCGVRRDTSRSESRIWLWRSMPRAIAP